MSDKYEIALSFLNDNLKEYFNKKDYSLIGTKTNIDSMGDNYKTYGFLTYDIPGMTNNENFSGLQPRSDRGGARGIDGVRVDSDRAVAETAEVRWIRLSVDLDRLVVRCVGRIVVVDVQLQPVRSLHVRKAREAQIGHGDRVERREVTRDVQHESPAGP